MIDLDAPISTYVKKLPNKSWTHFTSRQLASHTAGLAGYEENNDWIGFYQSLALTTHYENPEKSLSVFNNADTLLNLEPGSTIQVLIRFYLALLCRKRLINPLIRL